MKNFWNNPLGLEQEIVDRAKETTTIKTFNFTDVKKTSSGGGTKKPWSIDNLSATYSYSETVNTDPIIRENKINESSLAIDYNYSRRASYWQPLKGTGIKLLDEFNINLLPNSFRFTSRFDRLTNTRTFRLPDTPLFTFDNKRFLWDRKYNLSWQIYPKKCYQV